LGYNIERNYELFLAFARELKVPIIKGVKKVRSTYSGFKKFEVRGIKILHDDFSSRMLVFDIDLPGQRKGVRYILYISTQDWYLTPSKVAPKIRKVRKYWLKYYFNADIYKAIIAKRWTKGARDLADGAKIPLRKFKHVKQDMIKYFRRRYLGFINSMKGKRLYGELVFFAWLLQEILKEFGVTDIPILFNDVYDVLKAVESGIEIQDLGPPGAVP